VLVEMGAESTLNTTIAGFLFAIFLGLGIPPYRLAIGHQIAVRSTWAKARQPDFIVHSEESDAAITADGKILRTDMPVPMLVVEVVSNSASDRKSRDRDYTEKFAEYADRGIPEYWIADPDAALVTVCTLDGVAYQVAEFRGDEVVSSPTFPAFNLTTTQILAAGRRSQ
jgi:Uma2 family endonuclease